jgi:hypothetical protein
MRRAIRATTFAVVAFGAMTAPAAAAVFVGSTGGRIDIADGGASSIRYGVSAGRFLLYASPAPTPSAGCTTTTDPNVVTCPMAGIALVNFALGSGSSLDRAVGDSGPALHAEAARAAQHALSSLPERERRALVLRALGLPHRDVAASLGVSPLRARKLAAAARRELGARVAAGDGVSRARRRPAACARWRPAGRSARPGGLGWMPISTRARRAAGRSWPCAARAHSRSAPSSSPPRAGGSRCLRAATAPSRALSAAAARLP